MLNNSFKKYVYIAFFVFIFLYIAYYIVTFFSLPKLVIKNFEEEDFLIVATEEYVLEGTAINVKKILINNKEIFLDIDKNFKEKLYLFPKENQYIIEYFLRNNKSFKRQIGVYRE